MKFDDFGFDDLVIWRSGNWRCRVSGYTIHQSPNPKSPNSRGSAFVATIWIIAALTGLTLILANTVRVEILASANRLAQLQADAAARGAEQFVLAAVDAEVASPGSVTSATSGIDMEAISIGDAYVWIIKPDPDDETAISFGLTDEASKLDLNNALNVQLQLLPNMTSQNADCIVDWRTPGNTSSPEGAKDPTYLAPDDGRPPYHCKSAPFETVEELQLVYSITPDLLWGVDYTRSGHVDPNDNAPAMTTDLTPGASVSNRGIFPFVTVYGVKAATVPSSTSSSSSLSRSLTGSNSRGSGSPGLSNSGTVNVNDSNSANLTNLLQQFLGSSAPEVLRLTQDRLSNRQPFASIWDWAITVNITSAQFSQIFSRVTASPVVVASGSSTVAPTAVAKINVNTAPSQVLLTIPNIEQSDVDAITTHRQNNPDPTDPSDISWLLDVIPKNKLLIIGDFITGVSYCYSADILACSHDGRAFTRTRIVVDASSGTAQIIYRRDMSAFGWPLDPQIREDLRAGKPLQTNAMGLMKGNNTGGMMP